MSTFDWIVIATAAGGLGLWLRGCWRAGRGDCLLALGVGGFACAVYFYLFSYTRVGYLATMVCGAYLVSLLPFVRLFKRPLGKVLLAACVVLTGAAAVYEIQRVSAGNALLVIEPYRTGKGGWAFDEPRLKLHREPFVQGIPEIIDRAVKDIPGSDTSVRLIFSQRSFPGAQMRLDRREEQDGGNWYYCAEYDMKGWLCPALFKFFPRAPAHLYVRAEAK
jgi:hypothetical protein